MVARREIDRELGQPRRRILECRGQVAGANERPVRGTVPAAATPSGTGLRVLVFGKLAARGHKVSIMSRYSNGTAPVLIRVLEGGAIEAGADPYYNRSAHAW